MPEPGGSEGRGVGMPLRLPSRLRSLVSEAEVWDAAN